MLKKLWFLFFVLVLVNPETSLAQGNLSGIFSFHRGFRGIYGINLHYGLPTNDKWVIVPGLNYYHSNYTETVKLNRKYSGPEQENGDINFITNTAFFSLEFKRHIGYVSTVSDGGFYLKFGGGVGKYAVSYQTSVFDTTMFRPAYSQKYQAFQSGSEGVDKGLTIAVQLKGGYEIDIDDRLFIYFEGGFSSFSIPVYEINLMLGVGIRKKIIRL